jgi:hypothetical protein
MKSVDVVKPSVPGFGDHRQAPPVASDIGGAVADAPGNGRVPGYAHAVRVGNDYRSLQETALLDPRCAGHFAITVQAEHTGVDGIVKRLVPSRDNRCHAGSDRTFANLKLAFSLNQGGVADLDANHVRDGVELTGRSFEWNSQISRADGSVSWRRRRDRLAGVCRAKNDAETQRRNDD